MKVVIKVWIAVITKLLLGTVYYQLGKMAQHTCGFAIDYDLTAPINVTPATTPDPGLAPAAAVSTAAPAGGKHKGKCPPGQTVFKRPFFGPTVVFCSMVLVLFYFAAFRRKHVDPATYDRKMALLMFIPSVLECMALVLANYAAAITSLSLSMIMKGVKVVFSAIFTVTFLHRKQYAFHWFGVFLCLAGICLAGTSEYLNKFNSGWNVFFGCMLNLVSELMKAFRVVYDEKMLKNNKCDTLFVVGMEGFYSVIVLVPTLFIVWLAIPGDNDGSFESLPDSLYRISESPTLIAVFSALPIVVVFLAIAGMMIIKYLSAVHNALISVTRAIAAWALELIFFYAASESFARQYGEGWGPYSPFKLVGFTMVILATFIYDGMLKIPVLFKYPEELLVDEAKVKMDEDQVTDSHGIEQTVIIVKPSNAEK